MDQDVKNIVLISPPSIVTWADFVEWQGLTLASSLVESLCKSQLHRTASDVCSQF